MSVKQQYLKIVKAEDRIDAIMQRVRKKAIALNINPNMISELFSIMINNMVEIEIADFRNDSKFQNLVSRKDKTNKYISE